MKEKAFRFIVMSNKYSTEHHFLGRVEKLA